MLRLVLLLTAISPAVIALDANADLLAAARQGDLAAVKALVEQRASLETKTPYGQTPLYLAAMNGHEEVVRFLLDKGAEVDVQDTFYKMPLLAFVLMRQHYGVAKMLLAKGTRKPDETLAAVAQTDRADLVEAALANSKPGQASIDRAYEGALERKQSGVANVLKKAGAREPAPPVVLDVKLLESYAGTYRTEQIPIALKIFVKDGKLYAQGEGQSEFEPKARSATRFEFAPAQLQIDFDSAGGFTMTQGGRTFQFTKAVPK